jgi:serine/threonine-protein kinase
MQIRCPHCQNPIEVIQDDESFDYDCPSCGSSFNLASDLKTVSQPAGAEQTIGHFRLTEPLGIGQYGAVWKARDTELDRTVAVKIPRKEKLDAAEGERFLREARAAAQLKHPNIVAVHEVGRHEVR